MSTDEEQKELSLLKKRVGRRGFLKAAALAAGGLAAGGSLLAACSSGTATPAATETGTAAATATATAAATETATATATAAATETASATATQASTTGGGAVVEGGQLIRGFTQEAVNFNPILYVNSGCETAVEMTVFDSLWDITPDSKYLPNLAVEVPTVENGGISADGLNWTVKLRQDVKWHDGQPFTAKDVKFTYEKTIDPNVAAVRRGGHDKVATFETPDDYTCKITLKEPYGGYLLVWQKSHVVPEHILSKEPDMNKAAFNTSPVGTGPFKFKERVSGDHITFEKNPDYHKGKPHLDTVIQKYVPDQTVLFNQFKAGEVDLYELQGIPPERFEEAKALPDKNVSSGPLPWVEFFWFNIGKPQFAEKEVRQAIYHAINRQSWVKDVYYGVPPLTLSYLPPSHWAYNTNLVDPGFDPEKAKSMLDAAGWKPGGDGVREKNGVRLEFDNSTTAGNKAREQAQQLIQQNLLDVGIKMNIKNMPASVVWGEYTTQSQFDTECVGWDPPLYPDPDYTIRIASSQIPTKTQAGSNYAQYSNPEIDKLCEQGTKEIDQEKRKPIYYRIQEILLDELPFIPVFVYTTIFGATKKLHEYSVNGNLTDNGWNMNEWWKEA